MVSTPILKRPCNGMSVSFHSSCVFKQTFDPDNNNKENENIFPKIINKYNSYYLHNCHNIATESRLFSKVDTANKSDQPPVPCKEYMANFEPQVRCLHPNTSFGRYLAGLKPFSNLRKTGE